MAFLLFLEEEEDPVLMRLQSSCLASKASQLVSCGTGISIKHIDQ